MDKRMEEINDALIALIILKVFAQSAFKDSLWKKKPKPTNKKPPPKQTTDQSIIKKVTKLFIYSLPLQTLTSSLPPILKNCVQSGKSHLIEKVHVLSLSNTMPLSAH